MTKGNANIRNSSLMALVMLLFLLGAGRTVNAIETLTVTFNTNSPAPGQGYDPRNVHVVWVEDNTGAFVKTLGRWAGVRASNLTNWRAKAGASDVDGLSGATQTGYGQYTIVWDMTDKNGALVPDGTYKIQHELTNSNASSNRFNRTTFTFVKNGTASTQNISSQGGYTAVTVDYSGRPVLNPDVNLSPTTLPFGTVNVGSNKNLTFSIQNLGQGVLNVSSVAVGGADSAVYSIVSPPAVPFQVAAGGSQTITVRFTPAAGRSYNTATVSVASDSPGEATKSVALSGQGYVPSPSVTVTPSDLLFSSTDIGGQTDLTFDIGNTGPGVLHVTSLRIVGLDKRVYSLVSPPTTPFDVSSNGKQTITVRFSPDGPSEFGNAAVTVGSNDTTTPVATVTLYGRASAATAASIRQTGGAGGRCNAVALAGQSILLGEGATLALLDTGKPSGPVTGQVRVKDVIRGIAVSGNTAYLAGGSSGLIVVDISRAGTPIMAAVIDTPGFAYGVSVSGSTLCVADGTGGVSIYDVSTPNSPSLATLYPTQGPARAVSLVGSTAYVLDEEKGLLILDLTNPAAPSLLGTCGQVEFGQALAVSGSKACVTDRFGSLFVADVTTPGSPSVLGSVRLAEVGHAIALSGTTAYVAVGESGLAIVDASSPSAPSVTSVFNTPGDAADVAVASSIAYVADGPGGLRVLNVSNASAASETASFTLQGSPRGVAGSGPLAYLADGTRGLRILDLNSPSSPVQRGLLDLAGDAQSVVIANNHAYIANGSAGLRIVDVTSSATPVLQGSYATTGFANSVAVSGTNAIVADGQKVYVINVSNPLSPSRTGEWASNGNARGVAVSGTYAFVANGGRGLQVLDITNPASVIPAGSYQTAGVAYGVTVSKGVAYVADGLAGLEIVDVSNPGAPALLGRYRTNGLAMGVLLSKNLAYVMNSFGGVEIVDITNPAAPALYARSDSPLRPWAADETNSMVVVADDLGGTVVLSFSTAASHWEGYR